MGSFSDPALILPGAVSNTEVSATAAIAGTKLESGWQKNVAGGIAGIDAFGRILGLNSMIGLHSHIKTDLTTYWTAAHTGSGNAITNVVNETIQILSGTNSIGKIYEKATKTPNTHPIVITFMVSAVADGVGGVRNVLLGMGNVNDSDFAGLEYRPDLATWYFSTSNNDATYQRTAIDAPSSTDIYAIAIVLGSVALYKNGSLITTHITYTPSAIAISPYLRAYASAQTSTQCSATVFNLTSMSM